MHISWQHFNDTTIDERCFAQLVVYVNLAACPLSLLKHLVDCCSHELLLLVRVIRFDRTSFVNEHVVMHYAIFMRCLQHMEAVLGT